MRNQIVELLFEQLDVETRDEAERLIFFRNNTIRLSYKGNQLLSKVADSYSFEHGMKELKAGHIITITRQFKYPFYLSGKFLVLYSSEDAALIKLYGSVETFLDKIK